MTHWMFTEVPLSRQLGPEETWSAVMTTGTAGNKKRQSSQHTYLPREAAVVSIPGGVTNTGITFRVPARFMSVAAYVPVLAEVAAMVRVKLKEVVPAGEEQGLLRV